MPEHQLNIARVYDARRPGDGTRVLIDRLWPRGLTKEAADLDEWCKDVAPSAALRTWYHHDPQRFAEFARRYQAELQEPGATGAIDHLRTLARNQNLTLLTATKRLDISGANVLAGLLTGDQQMPPQPSRATP